MQQVFIKEQVEVNQCVALDEKQSHHLLHVLRMKKDTCFRVVDGAGNRYMASLQIIEKEAWAKIDQKIEESAERKVKVTLLMGLIKKDKWDFCIQKSTELGVNRIVPFESKRTIVKASEEKGDKKVQRWNKIAMEAAQQCKRDVVPEIEMPLSLKEACVQYQSDLNLVAYESMMENSALIRDVVKDAQSITVVIGPEGGFDESEIEFLKEKGYCCITLGKRILRAETAALYVLSALDAILE